QVEGDEGTGVSATFDRSYLVLQPPARRLFRLLGAAPGVDLAPEAVAALGGVNVGVAHRLLRQLVDANLVEPNAGRYAVPDLLRCYAVRCLSAEDGPRGGTAAARRLCRWYLDRAEAAALFADCGAASEWVRAERAALRTLPRYATAHVPQRSLDVVARLDVAGRR